MEITDVKIFLHEDDKLRAYVTVTFDASFVVHNMRLIEGQNGLFISMPSKKRKDGKYQDVAHPITSDMRQRLEKAIVENYKKAIAEKSREAASAPSDAREPAVAETAVQAPPPEVPQPPAEEQK